MRLAPVAMLVGLLPGLFLAACGGPAADPGQSVPYKVVGAGQYGITEGGILAATSVNELLALMVADHSFLVPIGPNDLPTCEWNRPSRVRSCNSRTFAAFTGLTVPADSLLVMVYRASTSTGNGACATADLQSVTLVGTVLNFNLVNHQPPCLPDDNHLWNAAWLVAIPIKSLPAKVLALKLNKPPDFEGDIRWPTQFRTVVDLALPPAIAPSEGDLAIQAEQAIVATELAVEKRLNLTGYPSSWYLGGVGFQRWADAGLGCAPPAATLAPKQVFGYVVAITHRGVRVTDVDQTFEYHVGAGPARYCSGP
jgi:hypothetical protein